MTEWTDELKDEIAEEYTKREPTPENTMGIVAELAEEYDKTVNGVRMILTKKGVYVKKTATKSETKSSSTSKRVNKAEAIASLEEAIKASGQDVDDDILSRMTGKAAVYFTNLISSEDGD